MFCLMVRCVNAAYHDNRTVLCNANAATLLTHWIYSCRARSWIVVKNATVLLFCTILSSEILYVKKTKVQITCQTEQCVF